MFGRLAIVGLISTSSVVVAPAVARAEWTPRSTEGRLSVYAQGGLDAELGGKVHGGGAGSVLGLPTTVTERGYGDVYDTAYRGELKLGYGLTPRLELLAGGSYTKVRARELLVGNVAGLDLEARFQDNEEISLLAGFRYYLSGARLRPYLTAFGGLSFIEANSPTFRVRAAGVTLADTPFYDGSTVGMGAAGVGMSYEISDRFALGAETFLRYRGRPAGLEGLAGTGLESINDDGARWSMPVLVTAALRF